MKLTRALPILGAAFSATALALVGAAQAAPLDGTYEITIMGATGAPAVVTFKASCATDGCTATDNEEDTFTLNKGLLHE